MILLCSSLIIPVGTERHFPQSSTIWSCFKTLIPWEILQLTKQWCNSPKGRILKEFFKNLVKTCKSLSSLHKFYRNQTAHKYSECFTILDIHYGKWSSRKRVSSSTLWLLINNECSPHQNIFNYSLFAEIISSRFFRSIDFCGLSQFASKKATRNVSH